MADSNSVTPRARRQAAVGRSGRRSTRLREKPLKQQAQKQQGVDVDDDNEWYEEPEWDYSLPPGKDSGKARQRIELLREERQLEQVLRDTFDY